MFGQNNIIILWGGGLRLSKFGLMRTDKTTKWIFHVATLRQCDNLCFLDDLATRRQYDTKEQKDYHLATNTLINNYIYYILYFNIIYNIYNLI